MFYLLLLKCLVSWPFLVLLLISCGLVYAIRWNNNTTTYWLRRKIDYYPAPSLFSIDFLESFTVHTEQLLKIYSYAKDKQVCGFWQMRHPSLLIINPHLVNIIMNDFKVFRNKRTAGSSEGIKDLNNFNLVRLGGDQWWNLRRKLSPAFTKEKIRGMYWILDVQVERFLRFLDGSCDETLDAVTICENLSLDCVASCVFGLELNTLTSKDERVLRLVRTLVKDGVWKMLKATLRSRHSKLFKALRLQAYDPRAGELFKSAINQLLELKRNSPESVRGMDFLTTLMSLLDEDGGDSGRVDKTLSDITDNKIDLVAAQVGIFLVGGFETTSMTLSKTLFILATREDVKKKVLDEIEAVIGKNEVNYENVNNLKYLGNVIDEVLRMYPPTAHLKRLCSEDYKIPGTDIVIPKDMEVVIPTLSLQNDPRYFPAPEKFIPERFSAANKIKIADGTYLPFGIGPRKCIAYRLSLLEMKLALCKILLKFDVLLDPRTDTKFVHAKFSALPRLINPILIKFIKRSIT